MIENIFLGLLSGTIAGLIFGLGYEICIYRANHVLPACTIFGLVAGICFGVYVGKIESRLSEFIKLEKENLDLRLESDRIKEQAVAAGLGYWREQTTVIKRDFIIASHTASFTPEAE